MQNLSLDEGIMPYKGRLAIKTYNPMKPDKYGVKFYYLCEAVSGYVYSFSVYRGISQSLHDTVFGLLGGLMGQGYHVYMDNYYNSVDLARDLYREKVHCTGTLRLTRGAPPPLADLRGKKQDRNFLKKLRNENTLIMCWYDTRLVSVITTFHGPDTAPYTHNKRIRKKGKTTLERVNLDRPVAIREYTKYMQGVDRLDQFMKYYSFLRKSRRWTKKIFFYFVQIGLQNAYALYRKYSTDNPKLTHMNFHAVAVQALIYFDPDEWPATGPFIPHAPDLPGDDGASQQQQAQPQQQQQQQAQQQQHSSPDPDSPPPRSPGTPPGSPRATTPPAQPAQPAQPACGVTPRPRLQDPASRLQHFSRHRLVHIHENK